MQLINGTFSNDTELFRDLYASLLNTKNTDRTDRYFILADFRSYAEAQKRVEAAYRDEKGWAKKALLNTACRDVYKRQPPPQAKTKKKR